MGQITQPAGRDDNARHSRRHETQYRLKASSHHRGSGDVTSGPMFSSIRDMTGDSLLGFVPSEVEPYRGASPGAGKEVVDLYLTYNSRPRVSIYYADKDCNVNKPYIFTIGADSTVTHLA